jgi:DNA invertase Pin-like site-specific DNA recombinase
MRIAIYAHVSTTNRQDVQTQIVALRDFYHARDFKIVEEYVDHAPANDLRGRTAWRRLLEDGAKRRFDACLCWKGDGMSLPLRAEWAMQAGLFGADG